VEPTNAAGGAGGAAQSSSTGGAAQAVQTGSIGMGALIGAAAVYFL
jgi:hypothetical protein